MAVFAVKDKEAIKDIDAKEGQAVGIEGEDTECKGSNSTTRAMMVSSFVDHSNCSSTKATVANIHNKVKQQQLANKQCRPTDHLWLH